MTLRLPYSFARSQGVLLEDDGSCTHRVGVSLQALIEVQRLVGESLTFVGVSPELFDRRLAQAYRDNASDASDAADADGDLASLADDAAQVDDLLDQSDDAPVVRLINALLLEAIKEDASDIHIETQERRLIVRFRIDGVMREMVTPKRSLSPMLISRIKVMAKLDIAEKRLPQDGRVSLRVGGHEVDVRVSTIPSQYAERVVLRLLDRDSTRLGLEHLGMSPQNDALFQRLIARPNGIMLVTGPTGSGKTTSLYAAIDHLNDKSRNIMTVEDPIEYSLDGIGQMQVNPKNDLTFARGLRAILRQDPDVIMVGEIRDRETAQVAVEAAMTGHLVLSTLHTNTAVGAISRLTDMGVERFLLAPMLVGVVAQRLVRSLCPECAANDVANDRDSELMEGAIAVGDSLYRAVGCPVCHGQGYRGRTGIYEVVEVDREIEAMIHAGVAEADLVAAARRRGPSLIADGARIVLAGVTTVEEVARVAMEG